MAPIDAAPTPRSAVVTYALAAPCRYTNTPPLANLNCRNYADGAGSRHEPSGTTDRAGCHPGGRHEHEHAGQTRKRSANSS